jgi:hypothetical protein
MAVYLHLFHGRDAIDEQLSDWGQDGPVLGPLPYVHVTYHSEIKIGDDYEPLRIIRDLVVYKGKYYGDWSIFDEATVRTDGYTPEKPEPRDTGYIVKYTTAEGVQITIRDQAVVNMISCLKKLIHENTGGYIASDKTIQEAQAIIEKTRPLPQMSQEIS